MSGLNSSAVRIQGVADGVPVGVVLVVVGVQLVGVAPPVAQIGFTVPPQTTVLFLSITQGAFTPDGLQTEAQGVGAVPVVRVGAVGMAGLLPFNIDCLVAKS